MTLAIYKQCTFILKFIIAYVTLYIRVGLESTKRLRKIENDLLIRNSFTIATTSSAIDDEIKCSNNAASYVGNSGKASINNNTASNSGSSNPSNVRVNVVTNQHQNQLVILCSANNDAATAKLAYEAGNLNMTSR